jgi:hypothetical protein
MKQKILTGILLLLSITESFAGNKDSIDKFIVHTFRASFTEAQEVNWEQVNGLAKASFNLNGQHLFAYYSEDARMVALGRDITLGQLPVPVTIALSKQLRRKKYSKYFIACVFEIVSDDVACYFIVLSSPDRRLVLKSTGVGDMVEYGTIIPPP